VWRVFDKQIDWFALQDGRYERVSPGADGILRSSVLPGFWLDFAALVRGAMTAVLRVLGLGLETPEHAAFVNKLRAAGQSK
jgi:hypothetical protein